MKTIKLTGRLAREFGPSFKLDVVSPAEAVRALCYMVPGFEQAVKEGEYRVTRERDLKPEFEIDETELALAFGRANGLIIEPVPTGSKKSGIGKIILGVVLIGAAFFFSGGALGATAFSLGGTSISFSQIALAGVSLLLNGVSSLLTSSPKPKAPATRSETRETKSFLFEGPQNVASQGNPVPLVYGQAFVGSVVVSTGISTEELPL